MPRGLTSTVKVRFSWYWKRYMRKNRYHYKRYLLAIPKSIGDKLDLRLEYVVQQFGPAILYLPKGYENFLSRPQIILIQREMAAVAEEANNNLILAP